MSQGLFYKDGVYFTSPQATVRKVTKLEYEANKEELDKTNGFVVVDDGYHMDASDVGYGDGNVKDALDDLSAILDDRYYHKGQTVTFTNGAIIHGLGHSGSVDRQFGVTIFMPKSIASDVTSYTINEIGFHSMRGNGTQYTQGQILNTPVDHVIGNQLCITINLVTSVSPVPTKLMPFDVLINKLTVTFT